MDGGYVRCDIVRSTRVLARAALRSLSARAREARSALRPGASVWQLGGGRSDAEGGVELDDGAGSGSAGGRSVTSSLCTALATSRQSVSRTGWGIPTIHSRGGELDAAEKAAGLAWGGQRAFQSELGCDTARASKWRCSAWERGSSTSVDTL
jgi:hypothetical protein